MHTTVVGCAGVLRTGIVIVAAQWRSGLAVLPNAAFLPGAGIVIITLRVRHAGLAVRLEGVLTAPIRTTVRDVTGILVVARQGRARCADTSLACLGAIADIAIATRISVSSRLPGDTSCADVAARPGIDKAAIAKPTD